VKIRSDPAPVLDALLDAELLEALRPVEPGPLRAAALKSRLLAEVDAARASGEFITVLKGEGAWRKVAPGVTLKPLVDAPGVRAFLLRMDAGASLPAHDHPTNEESMVLEGEVWLGDVLCHAGDFHLAPAGRRHGSVRTEAGCLLYVRTGGGKGAALL
jgi:anti-sigma factor ChrR (cupin superfamily)